GGTVVRDGPAGRVLTDTRALEPGCWFLALSGARFDGHDYVAAAVEQGAVGAVVSRVDDAWPGALVQVADTTVALQDLGRFARSRFTGPVVGLTGSSGKTTTRAFTALALSPLGPVHQTVGNLNNHLGVPMTLCAVEPEARAMVVEMGTSSPGEIGFLAELATPDIRLIVNVGPAHLQELGGLDGVAVEKGAIFATARPGDVLVKNMADPRVAALPVPAGVRVVTVGTRDSDVRVVSTASTEALGMRVSFATPEGDFAVDLPAFGAHIALDAALALGAAWAAGAGLEAATAALGSYQPVGMRMAVVDLPSGARVFNDAYNANPASMVASLDALAGLAGRKTVVLGDMLELGPNELAYHRQVAAHADGLGFHRIVLVGERMGAAADAVKRTRLLVADDPETAGHALAGTLVAGDVVLLKGSRGARTERVLTTLQEAE
ncbi:MAG: UDP-N-acetylmuramoyl-tripeptide--D-alanyl-D-alanine ligase, partial [Myxococcales bacterium]|nr:UDP-N-acetylmuramoyl-tripeptide--D-alanyl-D-alanine ligase [Myxococcales bacterium]